MFICAEFQCFIWKIKIQHFPNNQYGMNRIHLNELNMKYFYSIISAILFFFIRSSPYKKDRKISLLSISRAIQSQNTNRFLKVQCKSHSFISGIKFVRAKNNARCLMHLSLSFFQIIKWKSEMNQIKDLQCGKNQTKGFIWLTGWLISETLWIWDRGTE